MAQRGVPEALRSYKATYSSYWFDEDHDRRRTSRLSATTLASGKLSRRLSFWSRSAKQRDAIDLKQYGEVLCPKFKQTCSTDIIAFRRRMDGTRQLRRYVPELDGEVTQDLPPEDLRATPSRWPLAQARPGSWRWSWSGRTSTSSASGSDLSTNFLLLRRTSSSTSGWKRTSPTIDLLRKLPLVPPEWRSSGDQLQVIFTRRQRRTEPSGNLFLTNIHQLYESRVRSLDAANAVDALLGQKAQSRI